MIRSFLALNISEEIRKNLRDFIGSFSSRTREVRWVNPENLHVTLKFFGNIDEEVSVPRIEEIVAERVRTQKAASLICKGVGSFPNWRSPKVIWTGLEGETEGLICLQRDLEDSFEKLGIPREAREFRLHLTLGRIRGKISNQGWIKAVEGSRERRFGVSVVDHVTLYKSQLTKAGPIYTGLKRFQFLSER